MTITAIVCQFSVGLDELPRVKQRDTQEVARYLAKAGRFSVFEATANRDIARTMDRVFKTGWFVFHDTPYPWTKVTLTELGRAWMERGEPVRYACEQDHAHGVATWAIGRSAWPMRICDRCASLPITPPRARRALVRLPAPEAPKP